jgi:hypothetical protein
MIAILMSAALCGCSGPAQFAAQQNLDESQAEYAQCVATHGAGAMDCASARQDYETSQQAYDRTENQTPTALRPGAPEPEQPENFGGTQ